MSARLLTLCALTLLLTGCTFHRVKSNRAFRDVDPGGVVVGQSTWRDVLQTLGPPSGSTTERIREGFTGVTTFRYACADERHTRFLLAAILFLPFQWSDQQTGYELVVEFDGDGVVSDMYAVEEDSVWRPLSEPKGPEDRRVTLYGPEGAAP